MGHGLLQFVQVHWASIGVAALFVWTAFASTVPDERPQDLDDLWRWFRDFVRQAGNSHRPMLPKP